MNKILGIFGLLLFVCLFTTVLSESFVGPINLYNTTRWSALFGILSIGVAFVIITGGIDLSIGSVVGLVACLLPMLIVDYGVSPWIAIAIVLAVSTGIGLLHGLLITRLDLQPFVVTLCGLLFYRGFSRWLTDDQTLGFGSDYESLRLLALGEPCSWATMLLVTGIGVFVYGIWKFFRRPKTSPKSKTLADVRNFAESSEITALSIPFIGFLLALVGSARFWTPWEMGDGAVLLEIGGYRIRGLGVTVTEDAAMLPATIMRYAGMCLFVPTALMFFERALRADAKKVRGPILAVITALVILAGCLYQLVPAFREASPQDQWQFGAIQMSGSALKTVIMLVIFVVVGATIGSIGWLLSAASTACQQAKALVPLLITTAVMALLGHTSLVATMVPMPMLTLIALSFIASVFLNRTIYGRYLLALGRNEEAARYSGINTKRMIVVAYVICSLAAGLGGILFALDVNSVQPSGFGNFYELYAIAAAVLGGCSLRGGEGNILGVVIGAAVMRVLYNAINILGISTKLEFAIIGIVILTGAIVDVMVNRIVAKKAVLASQQAKHADVD